MEDNPNLCIRYLLLGTLKENPITLKRKLKAFSDGEIYFNCGGYYDNNTRFRLHTFSKDGYQCHSCKKRFHKEDLEIKGWHLKEWVCPNCKHLNYTYDEED